MEVLTRSMSQLNKRQVLHLLGALLLIALVVPFVIYAVPGVVGADGSYVVLSGSMEPEISTGDVVIVQETDPATIQEGDVITFVRSGEEIPTTHRVIDVVEQDGGLAFQTQGDNVDIPDASLVPASQVNGQVILTIPYIGYVVEFVNTPYGFVALVVIPIVLLVLSELYSLLRGANEPDTDQQSSEAAATAGSAAADSEAAQRRQAAATAADGAASGGNSPDPGGQFAATDRAGDTSEADDSIVITRTDLRFSLGILLGTTAYAGWVVTRIQEPWSFSVAFASGIGLVLVGGMYYLAGVGDTTADQPDHGVAYPVDSIPATVSDEDIRATLSQRLVIGSLSTRDREIEEVPVDSITTLAKMAAEADEWIIDDIETDGYYLLQERLIYSWHPNPSPDEQWDADSAPTAEPDWEADARDRGDSPSSDTSQDSSEKGE